jgi:hypothetical protein
MIELGGKDFFENTCDLFGDLLGAKNADVTRAGAEIGARPGREGSTQWNPAVCQGGRARHRSQANRGNSKGVDGRIVICSLPRLLETVET